MEISVLRMIEKLVIKKNPWVVNLFQWFLVVCIKRGAFFYALIISLIMWYLGFDPFCYPLATILIAFVVISPYKIFTDHVYGHHSTPIVFPTSITIHEKYLELPICRFLTNVSR